MQRRMKNERRNDSVSARARRAATATCAALVLSLLLVPATATGEDAASLLPERIALRGELDSHQLLVVTMRDGVAVGHVENATLASSNPKIARIQGNTVIPVADGTTTITASAGGRSARSTVVVTGMKTPHPVSFRHDVEPVFAKIGCNAGACHGALAGKGGFRLSLRGYDPERDYFAITREARGRRIELTDPGRSLLLAKPTGAVAHKGGVRFDVDDEPYNILARWIGQGAPRPRDDDSPVTHLEVLPHESILTQGAEQPLLVRAHYADGRVRDVTRWAKFTATDAAVATVDEDGRIAVVGPGEGAVVAWYASHVRLARVSSPFKNVVAPERFANAPRANFIDEHVLAQLEKLQLPPSPRSSDDVFIRRAFLDTIGVLPTAAETEAFLEDPAADRREKLIDKLLGRPEFVDYWAYKWSDVLLVNGKILRPAAVRAYYEWIRRQVRRNTPWDEFARRVVTATGSSFDNGATNFFAVHQTPEDMSENVSQAFMGLSIGCAKCHNHPLEKWTNDQYYSMANMFARVRAKGWGGDPRGGDGRRTVYVTELGELIQPRTGRPQPPAPLDGKPLSMDAREDRRLAMARWLTAPENPYFSRAIANRIWANFLGVGLVEQVDDLRLSNPASNEPLLAALSEYLVHHDYDLKALMRQILLSETYQRSSRPLTENTGDRRYYSRYYPRRLTAEVLHDAICQVTEVPTQFTQTENVDGSTEATKLYPRGTRAMQLYDSSVVSGFLKVFGRNERAITCECERSSEPTVVQVLHIANGRLVNKKLASDESCVARLTAAGQENAAAIDRAYLTALSRHPTDDERTRLLALLNQAPPQQRRAALEDLYWSILSSREFLFQH